jgi:hypothetical protein
LHSYDCRVLKVKREPRDRLYTESTGDAIGHAGHVVIVKQAVQTDAPYSNPAQQKNYIAINATGWRSRKNN